MKKFNEDSVVATVEASASRPKKALPKKSAVKPSSSTTMPSRPSSSKSNPQRKNPQATSSRVVPTPSIAAKSSTTAAKSSTPVHLATCQRTAGFSIASGASASSSAPLLSSTGPTLLKVKATAGRGSRPSPHKKQVAFQVPSDDDEADDEELAEIIRDKQERAARAKGSAMPLILDPKKILGYIYLWHKDPNTPLPD